jgi:ferredoxin
MSDQPKLRIDWIACNGYGVCETAAPDLIVLDDWGYPVLPDGPVPRDLVRQAEKAINDCPMLALAWENRETSTGGRLERLLGRGGGRPRGSS